MVRVGIAARRAAVGLLPVAYTCRPYVVRASAKAQTRHRPRKTSSGTGTPETFPVPNDPSAPGMFPLGAPFVHAMIAPSTSVNVANVATNGGALRHVTRIALAIPTPMPRANASRIASASLPSLPPLTTAMTTMVRPLTAPTDRSMPPTRSVNVWPSAATPMKPICCATRTRFADA